MTQTINEQTLDALRKHGPMNQEQFMRVVPMAGKSPIRVRLSNAFNAGLVVRTWTKGDAYYTYFAPEEGPLLVALREVERGRAANRTQCARLQHEVTAAEAELQALQMKLAQLQDAHEDAVDAGQRLEAGRTALRAALYDEQPSVAAQAITTPTRVVTFAARPPINGNPALAIFDDPYAYPQAQEG